MWAVLCIYFGGAVVYLWDYFNETLHEIKRAKEVNSFRRELLKAMEKHGNVRQHPPFESEKISLWEAICMLIASLLWPIALSLETYNA